MMKVRSRAILPAGFQAAGIAAGIRKNGKPDLALFFSRLPARAACLFTANTIQAAPILVDKKHLKRNKFFRAVFANSGTANAFCGKKGIRGAFGMAAACAAALKIKKEEVLLASTGVIGRPLPLLKIKKALPALVGRLSAAGINQAKKAILTTDTFCKQATVKFKIAGRTITLCGIAKGAGMIAPDMATLLAFIFTDAAVTQGALEKALKICAGNSFNSITVDGCMSTNDTLMLLANSAAQNAPVDLKKNFYPFCRALESVCLELAKMIVKDGEGASKFITLTVSGAKTSLEAKKAAMAVANSSLFKAAIYGENPNFGRIAAALGASGIGVKEDHLKFKVSSLKKKEISVFISIGKGRSKAVVFTSDLTPEYVRINAAYN